MWIPAFAIVTVYYSITSWIVTLSAGDILSNSSIQTIPLSASTIAPASKFLYPVSLSTMTAAVKPTPVVPLPVVFIAKGAMFSMPLSIYDLAIPGSPTIIILISPRKWVPFSKFFSSPESSYKINDFFISVCPKTLG